MKKNVLFVSAALDYFDSSASNRNRLLVSTLSKYFNVYSIEFRGEHCSKVYNSRCVDARTVVIPSFRRRSNTSADVNSNFLIKLKAKLYLNIKKLIPDALFLKIPFLSFEEIIGDFGISFDYLFTSSDPKGIHLFMRNPSVKKSKFLKDAVFFQYWGDPLYGDVNTHGSFFLKLLEVYLLRLCSKVFFVSEATFHDKSKLYPILSTNFIYLPRCMKVDELREINIDLDSLRREIRCCYVGDFNSLSRNVDELIVAVSNLPNYRLSLAGEGHSELLTIYNSVSYLGRLPQADADLIIESSEICFIILNKSGTQVPGKVFDLALTDKVVIVLYEDESQIGIIPFRDRFIFCKNEKNDIVLMMQSLSTYNVKHPIEEYLIANNVILKSFHIDEV